MAMTGLLILISAFGLGSLANAAQERGNGGDVIVACANPARPKVQMFDLYEAQQRYGLTLAPATGATPEERVAHLIDRLQAINPNRARLYRGWLATFRAEANFIQGQRLVDVPDTGAGAIPADCNIAQLVVQAEPRPGTKRYTIDQNLWDQMDLDNQAATILHELILREALLPENNHLTSELSRYLHAFIESTKMAAMTEREWMQIVQSAGFQGVDASGISIVFDSETEFYENGQLKSAHLPWRGEFRSRQINFHYDCTIGGVNTLDPRYLPSVVLYANGNLRTVNRGPNSSYGCVLSDGEFGFNALLPNVEASFAEQPRSLGWNFFENGVPEYFYSDFIFRSKQENSQYRIVKSGNARFWPSGFVRRVQSADVVVQFQGEVFKASEADFDEAGHLLNFFAATDASATVIVNESPLLARGAALNAAGVIQKLYLYYNFRAAFKIQGRWEVFRSLDINQQEHWLPLHPNLSLRCAVVDRKMTLLTEAGVVAEFPEKAILQFNDVGLVVKVVNDVKECQ